MNVKQLEQEILMFENTDLENIFTPVKVDKLEQLLTESDYDQEKTQYLVNGFKHGFSLEFEGDCTGQRTAPNLKLRVGNSIELWNKVMLEVKANRYAGPFEEPPFKDFIQSPIGLVPKDKGKKTRLIFHLSYPRTGDSVNSGIPYEKCKVAYPDFEEAVKLCKSYGPEANMAKSDMSMAFRHIPMLPKHWKLLVMKAKHPVTGKIWWFVDKCLPFGSSISCKIFQDFSDAVAHIVQFRVKKPNVNYLDDYMFVELMKRLCDSQVNYFLQVCETIKFPVSLEKTVWGNTLMVFLGLMLDSVNQVVCIPIEKITKAQMLIDSLLNKKSKKATVLEIQKLCGFLNFLCKCIIPGRVFMMRTYALVSSKLKPHHHIRIKQETRMDLLMWKKFLSYPEICCRPFMEFTSLTAVDIDMYSDASKSFSKGFGAYCHNRWTYGIWDYDFMIQADPSIEYLELFAVTVAVLKWIKLFNNNRIYLFCDNQSVCHMINNTSSKCRNCMVLLRIIVLEGLIRNVRIYAKHVKTKLNGKADALSRLQFKRFWRLSGDNMDAFPSSIPEEIWPINKIWIK